MFTIDRVQREVHRLVFTFNPVAVVGNVVTGGISAPQPEVVPSRVIPTRRIYATEEAANAARAALIATRKWGKDELVVRPITRN